MKSNIPTKTRLLSADEYSAEINTVNGRNNIASVRFIPPNIHDDHFGMFEVTYKVPTIIPDSMPQKKMRRGLIYG